MTVTFQGIHLSMIDVETEWAHPYMECGALMNEELHLDFSSPRAIIVDMDLPAYICCGIFLVKTSILFSFHSLKGTADQWVETLRGVLGLRRESGIVSIIF